MVTVPSGEVGVLWKRFGGGTVLDPRDLKDEGLHFIWPWNELFLYDLRVQSLTETYNAISSDGVSLTATINIRFRLKRDCDPHAAPGDRTELLKTAGPGDRQPDARGHRAIHRRAGLLDRSARKSRTRSANATVERLGSKMMEREGEVLRTTSRCAIRSSSMTRSCMASSCRPSWSPPSIARPSSTTSPRSTSFASSAKREKSERKKIEAEGIREFQQIVSQGISDSYLRWRGIEATLQLSQSTNSKVVVIGGGKDGLPIILGNVDGPPQPSSGGGAAPNDGSAAPKERTTAPSPAMPLEQTPAAGLTKPAERPPEKAPEKPSAAAPQEPRASLPSTLSDIDAFLSRLIRPGEPKTEPAAKQKTEAPSRQPAPVQQR